MKKEKESQDFGKSRQIIKEASVVFFFNRNPKEMMNAICEGLPLRKCREDLEKKGFERKLIHGTLIFVHPAQHRTTMLELNERMLCHSDIVISSSLEYLGGERRQHWETSQVATSENKKPASLGSHTRKKPQRHGLRHNMPRFS